MTRKRKKPIVMLVVLDKTINKMDYKIRNRSIHSFMKSKENEIYRNVVCGLNSDIWRK